MGIRTRLVALAAAGAMLLPFGSAPADTVGAGFEPPAFTVGSVNGQNGWKALGSAGMGCATYDHKIVDNTGAAYSYPSFGAQSLRMSNAVTSGCFGDQTFSVSTVNDAGESDAATGGYSGGVRTGSFVAEWSFASATPDAYQPGLQVTASPDRGDGARMSWIQMADAPEGLGVNFYEYRSGAVEEGCDTGSNFVFTNVASGLSRSVPHTLRVEVDLPDGPANDVVRVFVDGTLRHTGTTWEDYFRECEGSAESRTVDSILFRTAGPAAPATLGKGLLIDGFEVETFIATTLTATPVVASLPDGEVYVTAITATLTAGDTPLAGRTIEFSGLGFGCTAETDEAGVASCAITDALPGVVLGYDATFAGDDVYHAASASAGLVEL